MVIFAPSNRDDIRSNTNDKQKDKSESACASNQLPSAYSSIELIKDIHVYGTLESSPESRQVYEIIPADYGLVSFGQTDSAEEKSEDVPPPIPPKPDCESKAIENATNELIRNDIAPELPPRSRTDDTSEEVHISLDETVATDNEVISSTNVLSIKEIGNALRKLGLQKYVDDFDDAAVDGVILSYFDEDILCDEFKMKRSEAIKVLTFAKSGHIPK